MDTDALLGTVREICFSRPPATDIPTAIQTACSLFPLTPQQGRERASILRAKRSERRGDNKCNKQTSGDILGDALQPWASSSRSGIVLLEGSHAAHERFDDFPIEIIDQISAKSVPLIWALNVPFEPRAEECIRRRFNTRDIVAQLCLQLLQQNLALHRQNALDLCLKEMESAATDREWLSILFTFSRGLDEVYMVVDLAAVDYKYRDTTTEWNAWIESFFSLFAETGTEENGAVIKAVLFSPPPIPTFRITSNIQIIRIPSIQRSKGSLPSIRMPIQSYMGRNTAKWLECIGGVKRKRTHDVPEYIGNQQHAMVSNSPKRIKVHPTWTRFWSERFNGCIKLSRKVPSIRFPRVKIAILDTGVDLSHPYIAKAVCKGRVKHFDFVTDADSMCDMDGHGTHCASVLLRYAPNAEIYVGRVFERSNVPCSAIGTLAKAVKHAADVWKVNIISISLGFPKSTREAEEEISMAAAKNVLIFASASNNTAHETAPIPFPARMSQVFCIFAADGEGCPCRFNPRARYDAPNFMLPGESILGAWPAALVEGQTEVEIENGLTCRRLSGTSCATPIAAAVAAGVLEFAWQPRDPAIQRVDRLKQFDKMKNVFIHMADGYKPGDGLYHYVLPWKVITTEETKQNAQILLNSYIGD